MKDYGRLANRTLDEMEAGARVDVAPYKKGSDGLRAVETRRRRRSRLAEPVRIQTRAAPAGTSSARRWPRSISGQVFDIHGGGIDLVFPHHENEIAQSRCAHGTPVMANVWMHNGFLQVEGEKMSKSLGNFVTISELLETEIFGGRKWRW